MVVNNNAAAVLLVLAALAAGREVPVSRGESVEIGGGFRVPEVMEQSGARLVDVGTTNRTRLADYRTVVGRAGQRTSPSCSRCTRATTASTASSRTPRSPSWRRSGRRSSSTSAAACSTPPARGGPGRRRRGWQASRPPCRRSPPAPPSSRSAATSCSAARRPGSSPDAATSSSAAPRHPLARALRPGGLVLAALQDVALAYLRRDVVSDDPVLADGRDARSTTSAGGRPTSSPRRPAPSGSTPRRCPEPGPPPARRSRPAGVRVPRRPPRRAPRPRPADHRPRARRATVLDLRAVEPADDAVIVGALRRLG